MQEIWKDIEGYNGYQVSDLGRIKSLSRLVNTGCSGKRFVKGRVLKPWVNANGYLTVCLNRKTKTIHVLVSIAFLGHKPCGHGIVTDHINNVKTNNSVSNLQLITSRENSSKDRKRGASRYVGVHWFKRDSKWRASIHINGERKNLGVFASEIEAHQSYQKELSTLL